MAFDILNFLGAIDNGLASTSSFDVSIFAPAGTQLPFVQPNLTFRVESATFPGRQIASSEFRSYGPLQKVAYEALYGEVDIVVMMSPDFGEKLFFERWQDIACGFVRGSGPQIPNAQSAYNIGYYVDYAATVLINQYDVTGFLTYQCLLRDAWPTTVSPVQGNWHHTEVQRLGVSFAYQYFSDDPGYIDQARAIGLLPPQDDVIPTI